jgi:hypothetical protein
MSVNYRECKKAGIDPKAVGKILKRLNRVMRDAGELGLDLFCGSANSLRARDNKERSLIVGHPDFNNADGGCGAVSEDEEGLMRGE